MKKKKEDKEIQQQLLLKDLCARLPYGVKVYVKVWVKFRGKWIEDIYTLKSIDPSLNDVYISKEDGSAGVILGNSDYSIKPYLYPLSSMTEEQSKELEEIDPEFYSLICENGEIYVSMDLRGYDWLNENHFDYRGLIQKGLALDATNLNIY